MSSSVGLTLEETDDDFILVKFEQEDSSSVEDLCESQSDDEHFSQSDDERLPDLDCIAAEAAEEHFAISREHFAISRKQRRPMNQTIEDVVKSHVLSLLPAKSLYKFRAVSKEWEFWITNPFFTHQHSVDFKDVSGLFCQLPGEEPTFISLDGSNSGVPSPVLNFLPECVDIRASSYGLLCCQGQTEGQPYYICNPVTEQWKMLPKPALYHGYGTGIALVFEPSTYNFGSHYELIAAVPMLEPPLLFFEIYSSKTNTWRISDTVYCENDGGTAGDGFYLNGYAYWEMHSGVALAFGVTNEDCKAIRLPCPSVPTGALSEKGGKLCYIFARVINNYGYKIEVYETMQMLLRNSIKLVQEARNDEQLHEIFRAVCFVNEKTLILEMEGQVIAYNVKKMKSRQLREANTNGFAKYLPYVNSLVTVASPEPAEMA